MLICIKSSYGPLDNYSLFRLVKQIVLCTWMFTGFQAFLYSFPCHNLTVTTQIRALITIIKVKPFKNLMVN
jgi:hypothetical protein